MALSRYDIYVGQILDLDARGKRTKVRVTKVNPKNIKCVTEDGTTWNAHPTFLHLPKDATWSTTSVPAASAPDITIGTLVRFKNKSLNKHPLYVVIGSHSGTWRITPVGGDGGRYYRGIVDSQLEVVDFNLEGL